MDNILNENSVNNEDAELENASKVASELAREYVNKVANENVTASENVSEMSSENVSNLASVTSAGTVNLNAKVKSKKKENFRLFDVAIGCVYFIILNLVFMIALRGIIKNTGIKLEGIVYYLAGFLVEAVFGVAAWLVAVSGNVDIVKATGMNKKITGKMVLYGFLISFASLCFFAMLTLTYSDLLYILGYRNEYNVPAIDTFWKYILVVITSCAAPAFFEDLLFRGVMVSGMNKLKDTTILVFSALIFMLMHANADQTIHQFVMGIVLGLLFLKTKNLWLGVIVHFFNNFISVTMSFLISILVNPSGVVNEVTENTSIGTEELSPWTIWIFELLLALVLASIGYFVISSLCKKMIRESEIANPGTTTFSTESKPVMVAGDTAIIAETVVINDIIASDEKVAETVSSELVSESEVANELNAGEVSNENAAGEVAVETVVESTENVDFADEQANSTDLTAENFEVTDSSKESSTFVITAGENIKPICETKESDCSLDTENLANENAGSQEDDEVKLEGCDCDICEKVEVTVEEENERPFATAILLSLSMFWMVFEWLLSLLSGF